MAEDRERKTLFDFYTSDPDQAMVPSGNLWREILTGDIVTCAGIYALGSNPPEIMAYLTRVNSGELESVRSAPESLRNYRQIFPDELTSQESEAVRIREAETRARVDAILTDFVNPFLGD